MKSCTYCGGENDDQAVICTGCGTAEFKTPVLDAPISPAPGETPTDTAAAGTPPTTPTSKLEFKALTPEDMNKDFVTLMSCRTLVDADLIVSQLESAGISAFLPDQYVMQTISWNLNTYGYVRVQVAPKDYEPARNYLLAATDSDEGESPL